MKRRFLGAPLALLALSALILLVSVLVFQSDSALGAGGKGRGKRGGKGRHGGGRHGAAVSVKDLPRAKTKGSPAKGTTSTSPETAAKEEPLSLENAAVGTSTGASASDADGGKPKTGAGAAGAGSKLAVANFVSSLALKKKLSGGARLAKEVIFLTLLVYAIFSLASMASLKFKRKKKAVNAKGATGPSPAEQLAATKAKRWLAGLEKLFAPCVAQMAKLKARARKRGRLPAHGGAGLTAKEITALQKYIRRGDRSLAALASATGRFMREADAKNQLTTQRFLEKRCEQQVLKATELQEGRDDSLRAIFELVGPFRAAILKAKKQLEEHAFMDQEEFEQQSDSSEEEEEESEEEEEVPPIQDDVHEKDRVKLFGAASEDDTDEGSDGAGQASQLESEEADDEDEEFGGKLSEFGDEKGEPGKEEGEPDKEEGEPDKEEGEPDEEEGEPDEEEGEPDEEEGEPDEEEGEPDDEEGGPKGDVVDGVKGEANEEEKAAKKEKSDKRQAKDSGSDATEEEEEHAGADDEKEEVSSRTSRLTSATSEEEEAVEDAEKKSEKKTKEEPKKEAKEKPDKETKEEPKKEGKEKPKEETKTKSSTKSSSGKKKNDPAAVLAHLERQVEETHDSVIKTMQMSALLLDQVKFETESTGESERFYAKAIQIAVKILRNRLDTLNNAIVDLATLQPPTRAELSKKKDQHTNLCYWLVYGDEIARQLYKVEHFFVLIDRQANKFEEAAAKLAYAQGATFLYRHFTPEASALTEHVAEERGSAAGRAYMEKLRRDAPRDSDEGRLETFIEALTSNALHIRQQTPGNPGLEVDAMKHLVDVYATPEARAAGTKFAQLAKKDSPWPMWASAELYGEEEEEEEEEGEEEEEEAEEGEEEEEGEEAEILPDLDFPRKFQKDLAKFVSPQIKKYLKEVHEEDELLEGLYDELEQKSRNDISQKVFGVHRKLDLSPIKYKLGSPFVDIDREVRMRRGRQKKEPAEDGLNLGEALETLEKLKEDDEMQAHLDMREKGELGHQGHDEFDY